MPAHVLAQIPILVKCTLYQKMNKTITTQIFICFIGLISAFVIKSKVTNPQNLDLAISLWIMTIAAIFAIEIRKRTPKNQEYTYNHKSVGYIRFLGYLSFVIALYQTLKHL